MTERTATLARDITTNDGRTYTTQDLLRVIEDRPDGTLVQLIGRSAPDGLRTDVTDGPMFVTKGQRLIGAD